ncbi:MAG: hypothetical protein GQ565_03460 [Candidatus Aegiribacteria sp.]|nr:hypothetical protein [Candidatus Aegiribacteria sp.]
MVWKNISEISSYDFELKYEYFIAGSILIIINYLYCFLIWHRLTISMGLHVPMIRAARGWFLSYLGKYVPGKITLLLVRMDAYRGFSKKKVAVATMVEYIIALTASCLVLLISVSFSPGIVPGYVRWIAAAGATVMLTVLYPPFLRTLVNMGFRLIKQTPLLEVPKFRNILSFIGAYIIAFLLSGLALFLIFNSLSPVSFRYYLIITGIYSIAGLIGLAAFFAPSGIGVREGVLFLILPAFIAKPTVIVGVIAIRLVTTAVELFLVAVFVIAQKIFSNKRLK